MPEESIDITLTVDAIAASSRQRRQVDVAAKSPAHGAKGRCRQALE